MSPAPRQDPNYDWKRDPCAYDGGRVIHCSSCEAAPSFIVQIAAARASEEQLRAALATICETDDAFRELSFGEQVSRGTRDLFDAIAAASSISRRSMRGLVNRRWLRFARRGCRSIRRATFLSVSASAVVARRSWRAREFVPSANPKREKEHAMNGKHFIEVDIANKGCWLPSEDHCAVVRELCNVSYALDSFSAALYEAADGLDSPTFTEYWPDDHDGPRPAVRGFRVMTPDDETETMRRNRINEQLEREQLERLKTKYESAPPLPTNRNTHE